MPTKTKTKVVHDCGPVRSDLIRDENWLAPATPRGAKPTEKESHIIDAYRRGADLHKIVIAHHTHPATLFKLLNSLARSWDARIELLFREAGTIS